MNGERSRFEGQILDTYGFVRKSGYSVSPNTTAQVQRREHRWEIVYGRKNYQKSSVLKRFCRKGVPKDKRIAVWLTVSETGDGPSYEQRCDCLTMTEIVLICFHTRSLTIVLTKFSE